MPELSTLIGLISAISPLAFVFVGFAGLVMGVAPSSLPLYCGVIGYGTHGADEPAGRTQNKGMILTFGFILGMATVDAALGAVFGFLGGSVIKVLTDYLVLTNVFIAAVLFVFALALLRKIRLRVPVLRPIVRKADSFWGAYGLGLPFGLSNCPACTPLILPILGAAAATRVPWLGAALLFVFGICRGLPLLALGTIVGSAARLRKFSALMPVFERISGFLLLLAALYFVYQSAAYAGYVIPFRFLF